MPTCLPLVTRPSGILTSDTFTLFKPSSDPKSTVAPLYSCQQLINSLASYTGMLEPPYYVQMAMYKMAMYVRWTNMSFSVSEMDTRCLADPTLKDILLDL